MKKYLLLPAAFALVLTACKKEGPGGECSVHLDVKHHTLPIRGAMVYIKYNAKESPGTDVSVYDASTTSGADAHAVFDGLQKGDYYIYGVGYDSVINMTVTGGIPVKFRDTGEQLELTLPVTE